MVTRFRPIVAATLGALLCLPTVASARVPATSVSAIALHAPALERRGRLEIDATALGESQDVIVDRIQEMTKVVFEREAVSFADGPDDPVMKILVVPLEGDTAGYRITWHVQRGADEVPGSKGFSDCRLCTEGELVDAVVAGIELSVEKMEVRVEPEPEPAAEETPTDDVVADPTGPAPGEDKGSRKLGAMGIAGIALTVVGAAGLGTGIGLVVKKPTVDDDDPTMLRDTRNPGYGALAGGAALAVAGVVLLVLDLRRSRSTARLDRTPRTVMAPWVVPGSGGLSLQRRF